MQKWITKKQAIKSEKASLVKSSNNVNIAGSNTAKIITKKDNDGTNIAGLIYELF